MEYIQQFLMNNIWGMVLLGAAGSILGSLLLVYTKRVFSFLFPKLVTKAKESFRRLYMWAIKQTIDEHMRLYFMSSKSKLQAYYASLVARIALWLFVTTWLILGSVFLSGSGIVWGAVCVISLAFLSLFLSIRSYLCLSAAWYLDLEAKVDQSANEAIEKVVEEAVENILPKVISEFVESQANRVKASI